jgi:hypothetical protein
MATNPTNDDLNEALNKSQQWRDTLGQAYENTINIHEKLLENIKALQKNKDETKNVYDLQDELNKKVIINCIFFIPSQLLNIELPLMSYISSFTEADLNNHINLFMESIKTKN